MDPAPLLPDRVAQRSRAGAFPFRSNRSARKLPFDDRTFDSVVSTWTLCTIPNPVKSLDAKVAGWQGRLNPIQNIIGCGCNLNREIDHIIAQTGVKIMTLDRSRYRACPDSEAKCIEVQQPDRTRSQADRSRVEKNW